MASTKPDDETLPGSPVFQRPTPQRAPRASPAQRASVAQEASRGPSLGRPSRPRTVLAREEILEVLARSLRVIATGASHPRVAFEELRADWLPVLRQALEQGGGDGVDAWLAEVLEGRAPAASLFSELGSALRRMRVCRDLAMLEEEGLKVIELVHRALMATPPRPLSLVRVEKDLEGRLDVEQLLGIVVASDDELTRRISEIGSTMGKLKDQLSSRSGSQPGGMYSSFARLKGELLLLRGELGRRGPR